ncbi:MAG TPA: hypothetical protein VNC40_04105 [Gaiellaceae bacterium]|nr:hypothetical protein [Gaiellaceae bacterium]
MNENISRLEDRLGDSTQQPVFICERSNDSCTERIPVDAETYQRVREHPRRFLVLPGHVDETLESRVEAHPGYVIVEKTGAAGEVAEQSA